MQIKWVRLGLDDLDAAGEYMARDNPEAAGRVYKRVWDAVQLLAEQPDAGRAGRVPGTRELVVADTPFIIPYRVLENTVQILRFCASNEMGNSFHTRR